RTKIPLGGTNIIRKALTSQRIDVYWEFTGSGLNLLGQHPIGDPQAAYVKVKELDAAKGVTWLPPARLNDTYALAVKANGPTAALIVKNGLRVLDDDRAAFGAYTPAPTVLTARRPRWPNLAADLSGLTAALDTPTMTMLNAQVDLEKLPPEQVARDFLVTRGL